MIDANLVWSVPQAIEYMKQLVSFMLVFIKEPTIPDMSQDMRLFTRPKPYGVGIATCEAAENRLTSEQLLQSEATDAMRLDNFYRLSMNYFR